MKKLIFSTLRNIGLGIFVNGAFALQFGEGGGLAYLAIVEGIAIMLLAGRYELRSDK